MTIKTNLNYPHANLYAIHFIYRCPHRLELLFLHQLVLLVMDTHHRPLLPAGWHRHQPEVPIPHLPRHLVAMLLIPHLPLLPAGGHRHQLGLLCLLLLVLLVMDTQLRHPAAMLLIPHLPRHLAEWHHHQPEVLILLRPQRLVYKQGPSFYLWGTIFAFSPTCF